MRWGTKKRKIALCLLIYSLGEEVLRISEKSSSEKSFDLVIDLRYPGADWTESAVSG